MKKTFLLLAALSLLPVVPALAGNFTDHGDSTVTDNITGLMWQQSDEGTMIWENALTYCEGLSLAGYDNWRLPNVKELESLTDETLSGPATDTNFFPEAIASFYWSSTSYAPDASLAWNVNFTFGQVNISDKAASNSVRCVR